MLQKKLFILFFYYCFLFIIACDSDNIQPSPVKISEAVAQKPVELKAKFISWTNSNRQSGMKIATALLNNRFSTLSYVNWSCSWELAYTTDIQQSRIQGEGCNKNIPKLYTLTHNEIESRIIVVLFDTSNQLPPKLTFRIGFHLAKTEDLPYHIDSMFQLFKDSSNIIWSNQINL